MLYIFRFDFDWDALWGFRKCAADAAGGGPSLPRSSPATEPPHLITQGLGLARYDLFPLENTLI